VNIDHHFAAKQESIGLDTNDQHSRPTLLHATHDRLCSVLTTPHRQPNGSPSNAPILASRRNIANYALSAPIHLLQFCLARLLNTTAKMGVQARKKSKFQELEEKMQSMQTQLDEMKRAGYADSGESDDEEPIPEYASPSVHHVTFCTARGANCSCFAGLSRSSWRRSLCRLRRLAPGPHQNPSWV
jgi:hypothetical protein